MTNREYQIISAALEECRENIIKSFDRLNREMENMRTVEDVVNEANAMTQHND